jgi:catechol 2,3-dioxygenase-like lactoylglutathione lyase family enzyme
MKATGLDRVIFFVRDMDKALAFFSGKLGMHFEELAKDVQERDGNRGMVCHETHLHLVQPFDPLPETAPPPMKQAAKLLKEREGIIMMLIFKVDDARKGMAELAQ